VFRFSVLGKSDADFDNLALEDFQRLLNQGIVFEIILVEGNGDRFGFRGGRGRRGSPAVIPLQRGWGRLRRANGGSFGFDEFDLRVRDGRARECLVWSNTWLRALSTRPR